MSAGQIPPGGHLLGGGGGSIPVHTQRIIIPNATEAIKGGLSIDGCDLHLFIVDAAHGEGWRVPFSVADAMRFYNKLGAVIEQIADPGKAVS